MINIKELYEQYLDEGYSPSLAVQMAKEEVVSRFKPNRKSEVDARDAEDDRRSLYASQTIALCHVAPTHVPRIRKKSA